MAGYRGQNRYSIGERLRMVRRHLNYTRKEMATVLGVQPSGYYKNEAGETYPGRGTFFRLQRDYGISMDWLLSNKGPMFYKQKPQEKEKEPALEDRVPEVRELLDHMDGDPQLKHEILAYFFKYRGKKKPPEGKGE